VPVVTLPLVALTTYREPATWGVWSETADVLHACYSDGIRAAGGVPVLLPPAQADGDFTAVAAEVTHRVDGLLVSGGADIDPACYGARRSHATGPARPDRDRWEIALVRAAIAADMPVLGVCRGMQILAVALGGTLTQHLPDVVGGDSHQPTVGAHGRHAVAFAAGSRLASIHGSRRTVATYHHQSVGRLPPALTATAWADDGTVEGIELPDASWVVGVQWHPEVFEGHELFMAFVAACARRPAAARIALGTP
jgi:putative glutamine amidotransferase